MEAFRESAPGGAVTSTSLGGRIAGGPAAIATQRGTVAVYVVGTGRNLYTPVAIPNTNGTVSVYALTTGGTVRSKWQSTADGPFRNSSSLGGHLAGDLAGVVFGDGGMSLYATGTSGHQYGDKDTAGNPFAGWAVL